MNNNCHRPFANALDQLKAASLRPTRQRLALARLLFEGCDRHVSAEQLHSEAMGNNVRVSLATVYNTLHQFTHAGLLREIAVDSGRSYFDTNTSNHHHFFFTKTGCLEDIPRSAMDITAVPEAPPGTWIESVDVVVRLRG